MNPKNNFASQLSRFLRLNGDKVISGSSKLSLTTSALCHLNALFDSVLFPLDGTPFDDHYDITAQQLFEDVKFLFDFVRKTPSLKIFHEMQTLRGGIDLSRFTTLSILELHKVPMHLVIGLDVLCSQLKVLICHRSICFLKEIFGNVEVTEKTPWTSMKELNIAYNYLEGFDHSLDILPYLEHIDASHNNLKHVDEIQIMKHLMFVNLNYNSLENIPMICSSLKVLLMRNNTLESLDGLTMLPSLEELDISYNCISEHAALKPLKQLHKLRALNLIGNPVFFHEKHRSMTAWHFPSSVIHRGILLDGKVMNSEEVLHTLREARSSSFYTQNASTHQTAINVIIEADVGNPLISDHVGGGIRVGSFVSDTVTADSAEENNSLKVNADSEKLAHGVRKKKRVRRSLKKSSQGSSSPTKAEVDQNCLKESDVPDHIKVKQLMEKRRKELKDGWLIPVPTFQHLAINAPPNTPATNSEPQGASNSSSDAKPAVEASSKSSGCAQPTVEETSKSSGCAGDVDLFEATVKKLNNIASGNRKLSENSDDIEVLLPPARIPDDGSDELKDENANESFANNYFSETHMVSPGLDSSESSDEESEFGYFWVETYSNEEVQSLLVKIKTNYIVEVGSLHGKAAERLDLRCLRSVEIENVDGEAKQLFLMFDTTIVSKQKRKYVCEDENTAKVLYSKLKPFVDARVFEDSIMGALQCMKCGSEFSKDCAKIQVIKTKNPFAGVKGFAQSSKEFPKEVYVCPNCQSTVVIQVEKMPLPCVPDTINLNEEHSSKRNSKTKSSRTSLPSEGSNSAVSVNKNFSFCRKKQIYDTKKNNSGNLVGNDSERKSKIVQKVNAASEKETSSSDQSKARRNSSQSNQSSSITVISDTESNLDVIPEKVSAASPVPSSSAQQSSQSFPQQQSTLVTTSRTQTPVLSNNSNALEQKQMISSSVTESLGHECITDLNACGAEQHVERHSNSRLTETISFVNLLQGKEQFSCETFTSIDHRLKLHLEVIVFDDDEILLACLQAGIVHLTTEEEFSGLLVISSKRLFVMKFLSDTNEQLDVNLKQIHVCQLKQLKSVQALLGNQGFSLSCGSDRKVFVFLVRDADLCNCFLCHLQDITNERFPETDLPSFILEAEEFLTQLSAEVFSSYEEINSNEEEVLLHLFGHWRDEEKKHEQSVAFIVTPSHIFVTGLLFKKPTAQSNKNALFHYIPLAMQKLYDLLELKLKPDLKGAEIMFKDEEKNVVSHWFISTKTKSSLFSFINAFKGPWESIFRVELPLCYCD